MWKFQISIFYSEYNIDLTYQMFKLRKCIILREKYVDFKFHGINTSQKSWDKAMFTTVWHPLFFL